MTKIELNISDELKRKAQQRATESGFKNLSDYLESLVESDAAGVDVDSAPPSLTDEALEKTLLARLSGGPAIEATPQFWQELNNQFTKRDRERSAK